jgi:hypothetical protein
LKSHEQAQTILDAAVRETGLAVYTAEKKKKKIPFFVPCIVFTEWTLAARDKKGQKLAVPDNRCQP